MPQKGSLVLWRPDIKVLDCTLRDGGLVNNFSFTDEFVKALYQANVKAGVDYMEFGYKASKKIFNVEEFGKWKFCDEASIREIVGDNQTDLKIAVMADVGRTDYQTDIIDRKDSVIDLIRTAMYIHQIPSGIKMIEYAKDKGYETSANLMAVSKINDSDLDNGLELLADSCVDVIYLVDSFGSFYPEQIERLTDKYLNFAEKTGKRTAKEHRKNTERTPKETNNKEKNDKNEKKVRMGTHQHIKIEPVGFDQLVNDFGKPVIDEYVERLDRYIEETGRYKNANHAGIIRRWITEDAARSKKKPGNNKFNNFHQRAYDYSELERQLLGK